jgi:nicotinamidase-related amidase
MPHPKILDRNKAALVVVDVQEAFRSAIPEFPQIASRISIAVRGFQALDLPIIVTEQYPKGLGRTAEEILFSMPSDFEFVEKTSFSSCGAVSFHRKTARKRREPNRSVRTRIAYLRESNGARPFQRTI